MRKTVNISPLRKKSSDISSRKFKVREFKKDDKEILLKLLLELDEFHKKITPPNQRILRADKNINDVFRKYLQKILKGLRKKWQIFVVEDSGIICGFVIGSIKIEKDEVLEKTGRVEDLFVEKNFRRQKIAHSLIAELEKWFRKKGCQKMYSDAYFTNHVSRKFHLNFGFQNWGVSFIKKL